MKTKEPKEEIQDVYKKYASEKVAIVGYAQSSMHLAPYGDPAFKIWAMNEFYVTEKKIDLLFEIHAADLLDKKTRTGSHVDWLKKNTKIPVFMQSKFNEIPLSEEFPAQDLVNKYGNYFTNSVSWMIAFAIECGVKELHIYGIDMATREEYSAQRPSVEYFIGVARGRGIKVVIPAESDLLKCYSCYGYEDARYNEMYAKLMSRQQELNSRAQENLAAMKQAEATYNRMVGAVQELEYWRISRFLQGGK